MAASGNEESVTEPAGSAGAPPVRFWSGDGTGARSARFVIALMAPIALTGLVGAGTWIAYAVMTSVVAFAVDTGGKPMDRLLRMAIAGLLILVGGFLGTLAAGHTALIAVMLAGMALLYGLLEYAEQSVAFAVRFLCIATSVGALFSPLTLRGGGVVLLFVAIVWIVSVSWDALAGVWRPSSEPPLRVVLERLEARRLQRWCFALVVAATVAVAFLISVAIGLTRPNWAVFAIIVTMRMDVAVSRQTAVNLLLGTAVGSAAAAVYAALFPAPTGLLLGMTLAALLRWPAQQLHNALGIAAMAAFIVLLIDLASSMAGLPSHAPVDRLVDVSLGCAFALAGLLINGALQWALRRAMARSL